MEIMSMGNIKEKLSVAEYEAFKENEDVYKVKDKLHFDFIMGFTKCRTIVSQDFSVLFKDMSVLSDDSSFHKSTDTITLEIMNHKLNKILNKEVV